MPVLATVGVATLSLALVALCAAPTFAQQQARATLRGVVTDSAGARLPDAEIRIEALSRSARSDTAGTFVMADLSPTVHQVMVRRLGYQRQLLNVSLFGAGGDPIRIVLVSEPVTLAAMEIESRQNPMFRGFEQRRSRGIGTFITMEQIEARNSSAPSDAFRNMAGVRVIRAGGGNGIRFNASTGMRGGMRRGECVPTIWVDGQAAPGLEIDDIRAGDIHGIEIYRTLSTTPSQFVTSGVVQCGSIVVWTRRRR